MLKGIRLLDRGRLNRKDSGLTIEEGSYHEWLRVGPDDATAAGLRDTFNRA